ncbi:MAG: hypothetical protein EA412_13500 [Chitinophagaceae bacterium]|nr:MAG: hypothetical protein EA412_13500 [Chitinophagaceae bacterium]
MILSWLMNCKENQFFLITSINKTFFFKNVFILTVNLLNNNFEVCSEGCIFQRYTRPLAKYM